MHNSLLDLHDTWDQKEEWWSEEEQEEYDEDLLQLSQQKQGEGANMRETTKQMILDR